ncbi:hypothetical protein [Aquimarina spongiae]|uniref:Uncharacterized protein n=1 Tax=Aquimarina spongiae TaxID=570521 RepID=A0A1M6JFG0_9FLAO|nr:hypothetical protein [Aquimarina spongiae]SHJ45446.1 hypothetical protein SAMN04488508_10941 [Aquimarina spongiae]
MLLLGKTAYRFTAGGSGGGGTKTPLEIDLGLITIAGDFPTDDDIANAINQHPTPINVTSDRLVIFSFEYQKEIVN